MSVVEEAYRSSAAGELLAWYAQNDPRRLDELAVMAALDPDNPDLDEAQQEMQREARRRLIARIADAKGQ